MPRRSFRKLSASRDETFHHHVYVVELDDEVRKIARVKAENPSADPKKPCVYVGMTGLDPVERFENHKQGIKASWFVEKFGLRLLPELFEHLNPMPYDAALQMESDLAEDLRAQGFTVTGGH